LRFDALETKFREFKLEKDPACPLCGEHATIMEPIDYVEFCGLPGADEVFTEVRAMSVHELKARLENGNGSRPVVIDVRNPEELFISKLDSALHIPLHELEFRIAEIEPFRDRDVALLCRSGKRSADAWRILKNAGYERIFNVEGGILAWADEIDGTMRKY
jgi:adenylyltransferase/sulfurtransferase